MPQTGATPESQALQYAIQGTIHPRLDRETGPRRRTLTLGALAIGFLAHVGAVVAATRAPVSEYDLSVYSAAPPETLVGLGLALAIAALVGLWTDDRHLRYLAYLLGTVAILSFVLLPVVLGYHFFGRGDALTHLGWVRDIRDGIMQPIQLLYPAVHVMALVLDDVLGVGVPRALLLATYTFAAVFLVFLPLTIWTLTRHRVAAAVAPLTAFLFLPVNNIGAHMVTHPLTLTVFFLPLVLFLLVRYVTHGDRVGRFDGPGYGLALGLVLLTIVVLHPQGALDLLLMLATIGFVQFLVRWRRPDGFVARAHQPVYLPTVVLALAFLLWVPWHQRVVNAASGLVYGLLRGSGGSEAAAKAGSLQALGGSIPELFLKLFLPSVLMGLLAFSLVVGLLLGWLDERYRDRNAIVGYLAATVVPLVGMFGLFFVASFTSQHYRHAAVAMVPISILGAIALSDGLPEMLPSPSRQTVKTLATVAFLVLLPLSLATVYASPYIYQGSGHVPASELGGYESTLEHRSEDVGFVGIRVGPRRQAEAVVGTQGIRQSGLPGLREGVPPAVFRTNLTTHYNESVYLPVTAYNRKTETGLYDGLRYPQSGFDRLETDRQVQRIGTTGQYTLYLVTPTNASEGADSRTANGSTDGGAEAQTNVNTPTPSPTPSPTATAPAAPGPTATPTATERESPTAPVTTAPATTETASPTATATASPTATVAVPSTVTATAESVPGPPAEVPGPPVDVPGPPADVRGAGPPSGAAALESTQPGGGEQPEPATADGETEVAQLPGEGPGDDGDGDGEE